MKCKEFEKYSRSILNFTVETEACNNPDIPTYLHRNGRKVLDRNKFKIFHKIYRLEPKNQQPLIPDGSFNALSCNWSKLIKHKHVPIIKPEVGYTFKFCYYSKIKNFTLKEFIEDSDYGGLHIISRHIVHEPEICDYSHIVILIKHEIFKKEEVNNPYYCEIYTHQEWENKSCLLKKRNGPFKILRKNYRKKMLQTFTLIENDLKFNRQLINFFNHSRQKTIEDEI